MDYSKILSPTVQSIKPSGIRKFFDIAETMQDVISLGVGEPDFPTPWEIRKAGILSLESGKTRYTSNKGLEVLRREICTYLKRKYDLEYNYQDEVLVTVGGSEAIDGAIRAITCPGDEIIIPQPSYVCYEPMVRLAGGVPVIIETNAEHDFKLTPEDLCAAITPRTKAVIMPYPCNPTGGIMEREDLEKVAKVLKDTNIVVISDEIYAELTFGGKRHVSIASIDGMKERTVVVNGFSKSFSMTGWRMGYACGPAPLMQQITKIHQFAIMCAPTTAQYAAIEALKNGEEDIRMMVDEYNRRRRYIYNGLKSIGIESFEPEGAFYIFPRIGDYGLSGEEFCNKLLYEYKCAIVPGNAFGQGGEGFARISYAYSIKHITQALERIEAFVKTL
jgi:aminotransferase